MFNFENFRKDLILTENFNSINESIDSVKIYEATGVKEIDDAVSGIMDNPLLKGMKHAYKSKRLTGKVTKDLDKLYTALYQFDVNVEQKIEIAKNNAKKNSDKFDEAKARDKFKKAKEGIQAKLDQYKDKVADEMKEFDDLEKEFDKIKKIAEQNAKIKIAAKNEEWAKKALGLDPDTLKELEKAAKEDKDEFEELVKIADEQQNKLDEENPVTTLQDDCKEKIQKYDAEKAKAAEFLNSVHVDPDEEITDQEGLKKAIDNCKKFLEAYKTYANNLKDNGKDAEVPEDLKNFEAPKRKDYIKEKEA